MIQYQGARYVPKFDGAWDSSKTYEALTVVSFGGNSFTSTQPVPAGIDIGNTAYWLNSGNYNAQVAEVQNSVNTLESEFNTFKENVPYVTPEQYGAKGDGVQNDTDFVQAAINSGQYVLMGNVYSVTNINVKGNVKCTGTINGNVTINNSFTIFEFNNINGALTIESASTMVQCVSIRGSRLVNENGNGVTLNGGNSGLQYCDISVKLIRARQCVVFDVSGNGWNNQNYIHDSNCSLGTGIVFMTGNSYDGHIFYNMGFEDIDQYGTFNGCHDIAIKDFRAIPNESGNEANVKFSLTDCYNIVFENMNNGIYYSHIEVNGNFNVRLTGMIYTNDGVLTAREMLLNNGNVVYYRPYNVISKVNLISEYPGNVQITPQNYDFNEPFKIYFDTNSTYTYFNIPSTGIFSYVNCFVVEVLNTPTVGIDFAVNNSVKLTLNTSSAKGIYAFQLN